MTKNTPLPLTVGEFESLSPEVKHTMNELAAAEVAAGNPELASRFVGILHAIHEQTDEMDRIICDELREHGVADIDPLENGMVDRIQSVMEDIVRNAALPDAESDLVFLTIMWDVALSVHGAVCDLGRIADAASRGVLVPGEALSAMQDLTAAIRDAMERGIPGPDIGREEPRFDPELN